MPSLPRAAHFLIGLLLIAAIAALLAWQVIPFWQQTQSGWVPEVTRTAPVMPASAPQKQHEVSRFNLFGVENQVSAPVEETPKDLPETRLRLTLTGVLAGRVDSAAGALIEGPDRNTEYYKVGDTLPGNAELHKVYADRVVVKRSGRLENLYFPASAAIFQPVQDYRDDPANAEEEQAVAPAPTQQNNVLSEERRQSIKDRLSNLRKRIINNRN